MLREYFDCIFGILSSTCGICLKSCLEQCIWSICHYSDWNTSWANVKSGQYAKIRVCDINFKLSGWLGRGRILNVVYCNLEGLEWINSC
jgi:hypothetical protein